MQLRFFQVINAILASRIRNIDSPRKLITFQATIPRTIYTVFAFYSQCWVRTNNKKESTCFYQNPFLFAEVEKKSREKIFLAGFSKASREIGAYYIGTGIDECPRRRSYLLFTIQRVCYAIKDRPAVYHPVFSINIYSATCKILSFFFFSLIYRRLNMIPQDISHISNTLPFSSQSKLTNRPREKFIFFNIFPSFSPCPILFRKKIGDKINVVRRY